MRRIECTISRSNCELSTICLVPAIKSTILTNVKSNNDAYLSDKFFTIKTNCLKNNLALSQYYIQLQIQELIYIDMAVKTKTINFTERCFKKQNSSSFNSLINKNLVFINIIFWEFYKDKIFLIFISKTHLDRSFPKQSCYL